MANGGETKMAPTSCPMVGGDGPNSYAQNSSYQKGGADAAKGLMMEGIKNKLDFKNPCFDTLTTFRIVDFGCSTGPNTFLTVKNIIEAVNLKYQTQLQSPHHQPLEFQVFFNDQTDNDFNTLFKTLPTYQRYFTAGVPGSFYNRLFPKSSIHFAHSSYALHWISKIPREVVESPALNKESIYCSGLNKEIAKSYLDQFKNDLDTFLNARAEEIVGGGLMMIIVVGRPNEVLTFQTPFGVLIQFLECTLNEMANLGVLNGEKVESFKVPLYYPTPKELEEIIKENGNFSIEELNVLDRSPMVWHSPEADDAKFILLFARATIEDLIKNHFAIGENLIDKIFQHLAKKIADNISAFYEVIHHSIDIFILLKRNINF